MTTFQFTRHDKTWQDITRHYKTSELFIHGNIHKNTQVTYSNMTHGIIIDNTNKTKQTFYTHMTNINIDTQHIFILTNENNPIDTTTHPYSHDTHYYGQKTVLYTHDKH